MKNIGNIAFIQRHLMIISSQVSLKKHIRGVFIISGLVTKIHSPCESSWYLSYKIIRSGVKRSQQNLLQNHVY